jgi:hypothetical protein
MDYGHLVCAGTNVLPMFSVHWDSSNASLKVISGCLNGDIYEYIAVYVDDLLIAAKDPLGITKCLEENHQFKLKGTIPLKYHMGCDYFRDDTGTLCFGPCKYIEKMLDQYEKMFGAKPKEYTSP